MPTDPPLLPCGHPRAPHICGSGASTRYLPGSALVTPAELCAALGWHRRTFTRAVRAGRVAAPSERTPGGHARWTATLAASVVRAAGKAPPEGWEPPAEQRAA